MSEAILAALRLAKQRGVAVVGASPKPERASHDVMKGLLAFGVDCVAVNPTVSSGILGRKCFASLADVVREEAGTTGEAERGRVVCVFRSDVGPAVEEALSGNFPAIWLQSGLRCPGDLRGKVTEKRVLLVEDACMKVEWGRHAGKL